MEKKLLTIDEHKLQEKFNELFKRKESRKNFFKTHLVSEKFIEKNIQNIEFEDWLEISDYQQLSEAFIEKYKDKVGWVWISKSQHLGEIFMDKYADKLSWDWISFKQKMSFHFIVKHIDKINLKYAKQNPLVNKKQLEQKNIDVLEKLVKCG
jgi:hypothetical protein